MKFVELLYNPDGFFEDVRREGIGIAVPLLIVVISGLFGGIATSIVAQAIAHTAIEEISNEQTKALVQFFSAEITPFVALVNIIGWVILSAVIYLISRVFSNEGNFQLMLKLMGFSYIPGIILFPVNLYIAIISAEIIETSGLEACIGSGVWAASKICSIAILVWQFVLWVFAVKNVRNLTLDKAIISALIPAIVFFILAALPYGF